MAKKAAPGPPRPYIVSLNNHHEEWSVDAVDEDAAIDAAIAKSKSLRDRRNFTARLRYQTPSAPAVPTFPGQPTASN